MNSTALNPQQRPNPVSLSIRNSMLSVFSAIVLALVSGASQAEATPGNTPQAILHILDYVSVDYANVIKDGQVVDADEYSEQLEFSAQLVRLVQDLSATDQKPTLAESAQRLREAILQRQPAEQVLALCMEMTVVMINAYHIKVAPDTVPALQEAQGLYAENCSTCHGVAGFGNGPMSVGLQPSPANFHDYERQQHRNIFSLYNTISLGVDGTAMPAFVELTKEQRWALAFYVSGFLFDDADRARGELLWRQTQATPAIGDLAELTLLTPSELTERSGTEGVAMLAYLRANPSALQSVEITPLQVTRDKLTASTTAYQHGEHKQAYDFAIAAYLEGYELVENRLGSVAPELKDQIEQAMMHYRSLIKDRVDSRQVVDAEAGIMSMLDRADEHLNDNQLDTTINFLSAFIILLREGIEAILILAAITAVLIKTGRRDALKYIHMGWISALLLGFLTWLVATRFIDISGAGRELTEGITALVAAAMLVYVGFWLHKQTYAMRWNHYIKEKVSKALSGSALLGLTAVAFIAVYREVFESILFYQSLWLQTESAGHNPVIFGIVAAALLLVVAAWLIFKFSVRLPLSTFFRVNAVLLYVLAIIFAGKGVAALQEAGKLPVDAISFFKIEALGIYPNLESLMTQAALIALAVLLFAYNRKKIANSKELIAS